jgi:hypothetical protein
MNIVPSLVDGYMFSEMYHLEGGRMSGGYPLQQLAASKTGMVGGGSGIQLANYVIPIGLVCDMRVPPRHINYGEPIDEPEYIDESIHDILLTNVSSRKGSQKKHTRNPSKKKSLKIKK